MKFQIIRGAASVVATSALAVGGVYAWNGLTASNGDLLDADKWNSLVSATVPSGAVMAFNLSSCPSGWSPATAAIGRTIIGAGDGAGSNTAIGATGGEKSAPAISVSLKVTASTGSSATPSSGAILSRVTGPAALIYAQPGTTADVPLGGVVVTGGGTAPDNMQPYVAYLYCQKQ